MKAFFKNLNFVRVITILSLIGAGVLGYMDWEQRKKLVASRAALAEGGKIEQLASRTQENGLAFTEIENDLKSDQLVSSGGSMETYIRKMSADPDVLIGSVTVNPRESRGQLPKGIVDFTYRVVPSSPEDTFRRERIANFFTLIETNSPRIKVTEIRIENADKRAKPHEIPGDKWTFEATVTSRQRED